jgi:N-acetylglucosamine-6-sulfatase
LPRTAFAPTLAGVAPRTAILGLLLTAVAASGGLAQLGVDRGPGRAEPAPRPDAPNIVVITTDDMTLSQFGPETMPFTARFFAERGAVFANAIAAPPLCCPSRAGFLTGQYPHHHGVAGNEPGYPLLRGKRNVLPVWLDRAGYRTALVGKFLNGYPVLSGQPAPGWDRWFAVGGSVSYREFDVATGDAIRHFGGESYSTEVYSRVARRFVARSAERERPFFLWLTPNAPHIAPGGLRPCGGWQAQPQTAADFARFADARPPASPALSERALNDKGRWIRLRASRSRSPMHSVERGWRCALSTLPAVDRGIRALVRRLKRDGELDTTIIVFTSDNGYFYGEHGITDGKDLPYDPALRVPLAIALPPGLAGEPGLRLEALVSNVDLAPTLLDYAEALPCRIEARCRRLDGRTLRPLLGGREPEWAARRAIPIELDDDFEYRALRTPDTLYVELSGDGLGPLARPEIELYDLRSDPHQLENLWHTDRDAVRARVGRLADRIKRLTR